MKVTINEKEFELKRTLRSVILYEAIRKQSFNPKTTTDMIFYLYATLLACGKDNFTMTLDDFVDYLDEKPGLLGEFSQWLIKLDEIDSQTVKDEPKKKTRKTSKS